MIRRPADAARSLLVGLLLLAVVVQGYATQTHIHPQDFAQPLVSQSADAQSSSNPIPNKNTPPIDDPARCPICQQILQAGQYVAPAWLIPLLIQQAVAVIEIVNIAAPRYDAVSHNWRSRGPPQS